MRGGKTFNLDERVFKAVEKLKRSGAIKTYSEFINEALTDKIKNNDEYYKVVKNYFEAKNEED